MNMKQVSIQIYLPSFHKENESRMWIFFVKHFKRKNVKRVILLKSSADINQIRGQNERRTEICSSLFCPSLPGDIICSHNTELQPAVLRYKEISDTRDSSSKQLSTSSRRQFKLWRYSRFKQHFSWKMSVTFLCRHSIPTCFKWPDLVLFTSTRLLYQLVQEKSRLYYTLYLLLFNHFSFS